MFFLELHLLSFLAIHSWLGFYWNWHAYEFVSRRKPAKVEIYLKHERLAYELTCRCHQLTQAVLALEVRQEWFPAYVRIHRYHRPPGVGQPFLAERLASLDVPGELNYRRNDMTLKGCGKRRGREKKCCVSNLKQWKVRKEMYLVGLPSPSCSLWKTVCLSLGEHYLDPGLHHHLHHLVLTSLPRRLRHLVLILKTKTRRH